MEGWKRKRIRRRDRGGRGMEDKEGDGGMEEEGWKDGGRGDGSGGGAEG